MKIYNEKGELLTSVTSESMEDLLETIEGLLTDSLDRQDKTLFLIKNIEKHQSDSSDLPISDEQTEEELKDMVVDVED